MINRVQQYVRDVEQKYRRIDLAKRIAGNISRTNSFSDEELRRVCMDEHHATRVFSKVDVYDLAKRGIGYVYPANLPAHRKGNVMDVLHEVDRTYIKRFKEFTSEEQSRIHTTWWATVDRVGKRTMGEKEYNLIMAVCQNDPSDLLEIWKKPSLEKVAA